MMGAAQIDRHGNQNISCIGDWRAAEGPAARRARRAGQHREPRRQLLDPPPFQARLRREGGHGLRRRATTGAPWTSVSSSPTWPSSTSRRPITRCGCGRFIPESTSSDVVKETGFELVVPDDVAVTRAPSAAELELIRRLDPDGGRDQEVPCSPGDDPPKPPREPTGFALRSLTCSASGIPSCRAPWATCPARGLVTAVSNAGGLGIIASATMSLAELRAAIKEARAGTTNPFGVNIRADAPDAGERVAAVIGAGVPVASFALAPKPDLIAALKEAGVVTIASVGARRHAEKVAAWGIDAVIATGGEGGGHTGAVPTSLLIPAGRGRGGHPGDRGGRVFRRPRAWSRRSLTARPGSRWGPGSCSPATARWRTRSSACTWRRGLTARW